MTRSPFGKPSRIFVRAPNWVGDFILAYPFFVRLRELYPEAWITVAVPESISDMVYRGLVNEVVILPVRQKHVLLSRCQHFWRQPQLVRSQVSTPTWDWGLTLSPSLSSAALLWRLHIPRRTGEATDGRGFLLTQALLPDRQHHFSQVFLNLLGILCSLEALPPRPDVFQVWDGVTFFAPPQEPYWVLALGSNAPARRWDGASFIQVATWVFQRFGWKGLVVGGPREQGWVEDFRSAQPKQWSEAGLEDWTGKGRVTQYARVFAQAQAVLSNDSGLAHVANFCGALLHIVWGAGKPQRVQPLYQEKVSHSKGGDGLSCWPCQKNHCRYSGKNHRACLTRLTPEILWEQWGLEKKGKVFSHR